MRSLRASRKALVFFPCRRSLMISSCFDYIPWLSGVAMGQSLPGHGREDVPPVDAARAFNPNAHRQPSSTLHSGRTRFVVTDIKDRLSQDFLPDFGLIQLTCQWKRSRASSCCCGSAVTKSETTDLKAAPLYEKSSAVPGWPGACPKCDRAKQRPICGVQHPP